MLLITVATQDPGEVPLARVYLRSASSESHDFRLASSLQSPTGEGSIREVLGPHRFDGLYLFPMHLRHRNAELVLDFGRNRMGFVVGKFPLLPQEDGLPKEPPTATAPPIDALTQLLRRELATFLELSVGR